MKEKEALWIRSVYDFHHYKTVYIAFDERTFKNPSNLFCSACKMPALLNGVEEEVPSNYCPNCGIKMNRQPTKEQMEAVKWDESQV